MKNFRVVTKLKAKEILKDFFERESYRKDLLGHTDESFRNFLNYAEIRLTDEKDFFSNNQLKKELNKILFKKKEYHKNFNKYRLKVSNLLKNSSFDQKTKVRLEDKRNKLFTELRYLNLAENQIELVINEQVKILESTFWNDFDVRNAPTKTIVGINKSYSDYLKENPISETEKTLENYKALLYGKGQDYIYARCINEIDSLKYVSQVERKEEVNRIINHIYKIWFGLLEDSLMYCENIKIEMPQNEESLLQMIDMFLPKIDKRFISYQSFTKNSKIVHFQSKNSLKDEKTNKSIDGADKKVKTRIKGLANKIRIVLRQDDTKKKILDIPKPGDRYNFLSKLLKEKYSDITNEMIAGSKNSILRYQKDDWIEKEVN